jgi:putative heme-binding domain-containing protein
MMRRLFPICLGILVLVAPTIYAADDLGLRAPPGFRVTLYADQDLANDIYAMTLDADGRVVVTSQGWIKRLLDTKAAGRADKAEVIAPTATGGMGLCFDGGDLYFCGDGWFSRYRAGKAKGTLEPTPEKLLPLNFSEHGGHAMRKGPDGYWYVLGGNNSGIDQRHITRPNSPVRKPTSGALLRLPPDCKTCEVIADGFRNPYDFDFNADGEIFTYDSDVEADYFLPWYQPTRLFHIGYGGNHGWQVTGQGPGWGRPDYYLDTVNILYPIGRGSPTGVVCYRHDQFPERYRGGLFACDWTFGRVYFCPLTQAGATYKTKPEVFLESVGSNGFDPTDIVVAPDGSLFISMGGRKTRGAVYHVEYVGDDKAPVQRRPAPKTDLDKVLQAPQPLDAWSRAEWEPLARKLGAKPFLEIVADEKKPDADRMRAIEVATELFDGLPRAPVESTWKPYSPLVRARVAWSLGRKLNPDCADLLPLMGDEADTRVVVQALEAMADHAADPGHNKVWGLGEVIVNLADHDKRVRQAAARLDSVILRAGEKRRLDDDKLTQKFAQDEVPTVILASHWRHPTNEIRDWEVREVVECLSHSVSKANRLDAIRLLILSLGDFQLKDPPVEAYSPYSLKGPLKGHEKELNDARHSIHNWFPSGDEHLDIEAARFLAMVEDDDDVLPAKVAAMWTPKSSATLDMHYLIVYSRLRGKRDDRAADQVADAILSLDRKLEGQAQRNKQNWNARLVEILPELIKKDPRLTDALLHHKDFVRAAHVALTECFGAAHRRDAARLFLAAVKKDDDFAWSGSLIDLLSLLPTAEVRPVFREQWPNLGLRDALLLRLADKPEEVDRERFLSGLESGQRQVVLACLSALAELPRDEEPRHLAPLVRLLRQLTLEPKECEVRKQASALLNRQSGQSFILTEHGDDPVALKRVYEPVFAWFDMLYPKWAAAAQGDADEDPAVWTKLLQTVPWDKGDAGRGEALFRVRACATCHTGTTRLGPDLTAVTSRFSRADLFDAIIYPSRDVAPPYRVTRIETHTGQVYYGIVAFFSADGVILQTGAATTVRVAAPGIVSQSQTTRSLMPNGLLKGLKPEDLADLYSYLQTLKPSK